MLGLWLPAAILLEYPTWWKYVDQVNEAIVNAKFDETIRNPWFLGISGVFVLTALLRGWKGILVTYIGGIAMWGIVAKTVMSDTSGSAQSGSIVIFAALVVGVAGLGIYFLLIRD